MNDLYDLCLRSIDESLEIDVFKPNFFFVFWWEGEGARAAGWIHELMCILPDGLFGHRIYFVQILIHNLTLVRTLKFHFS